MTKYLPLLLLSLTFGGCFADLVPGGGGGEIFGTSDAAVSSAELSGRVGTREAVGTITVENAYVDSTYIYVPVYARVRGNEVMNGVSIENLEAFNLGETYTFDTTSGLGNPGLPSASVLGCSGAGEYFDVDISAESVTVVIEDIGGGELLVSYSAQFGAEGETEGSFVIAN